MTTLHLIISIAFIILALRRLDWALQFLLFALPAYLLRFKIFGIPSTMLEVMILTVTVVWIGQNWRQIFTGIKNRFSKSGDMKVIEYPFRIEMILVLIVALIAVGVAGFTNDALGIWKAYFFEPLLLFIVMINVFGGGEMTIEKKFAKIIWPLALSALLISLFAVVQRVTGKFISDPYLARPDVMRATSIFSYPNAVGLYVESILWLAFGYALAFRESIKDRIGECKCQAYFMIIVFIVSILAIFSAKSVGASLGLFVGVFLFAVLANKISQKIIVVIILLAALGISAYQPTRQKAIKYITLNDFSGQVRRLQWSETWRMLNDGHLLTGVGLSQYQEKLKPFHVPGFYFNRDNDPDFRRKLVIFDQNYRAKYWQPLEIYMYPHNIFLNFWAELGVAGMLLFVWLMGRFIYTGLLIMRIVSSSERYLVLGLLSAMITLVVHGMVDVPYFKNDLAVIFWVLFVMMGLMKISVKSLNTGVK